MTSERRAGGFTLLEMLVVLLIAGMALALTSQALSQYARAHERVSASTQGGREYRLAERWFRDSVSGLYAVGQPGIPGASAIPRPAASQEDEPVFRGEARGFSGLTLLPVLAGQGVPTLQSWSIAPSRSGNDALALEEDGKQLTLPFPDAGQLRLHYLDAKGDLHALWPPAQGQWPQLPAAIALELGSGTLIVAAVTGAQDPLVIPYEPEPF
ncbi:PulJ/GspJ family protein [Pseudoxanthomonas mexicana]